MKIQVLWPRPKRSEVVEIAYARQFCEKLSRSELADAIWHEYPLETGFTHRGNVSDCVLFVTDPQLVVTRSAVREMLAVLRESGKAAAVPVYNVSANPAQIADLPAVYMTVTTFFEVAGIISRQSVNRPPVEIKAPYDAGCVLLSSREYRSWNLSLPELPVTAMLTTSALVHRFGGYAGMERPDLWGMIPMDAVTVLDVGCGRGQLGRWFRSAGRKLKLVGVEQSGSLAEEAAPYYDRIHVTPVESFDSGQRFDCIVCGDILEHLVDPWSVLKRLTQWLNPRGCLLLSIPNAGHWSLVRDLAKGRWDYLPYGLTCITHLRWFTENSMREICGEAGLAIESLVRQTIPATPEGEAFIRQLVESGQGDESSLRTLGFIIRARQNK